MASKKFSSLLLSLSIARHSCRHSTPPSASPCMPAPAKDTPVGAKRPAAEGVSAGPKGSEDAKNDVGPVPKKPKAKAQVGGDDTILIASPSTPMSTPKIPRYLLRVQYDGSNFCGFQRQATARTVQGCVEDALNAFAGRGGAGGKGKKDDGKLQEPLTTYGSSRTDAGVHALDATLHVDLERVPKRKNQEVQPPFTGNTVMSAVNHFLKRSGVRDAKIWRCVRVDPTKFHARYSATGRTYKYRIKVSDAFTPPSVFEHKRVWHVVRNEGLDVDAMRSAAKHLIGTHDFSSFRAAQCQASGPVRSVDMISIEQGDEVSTLFDPEGHGGPVDDFSEVEIHEEEEEEEGDTGGQKKTKNKNKNKNKNHNPQSVVITARAPSFLYHQVRLLVGTLKAVGCGDLTPSDVSDLLEKKDVKLTPTMAPACGLYLARVHYDGSRKWDAQRTADEAKEKETMSD